MIPFSRSSSLLAPPRHLCPPVTSATVGVGSEQKDPCSSVDRAEVRRGREQRRSPLEAQSSKLSPNRLGVREERGDVLDEHASRLALANDANQLGPQSALVVVAESLPGEAVGLAWQTGENRVDSSAPSGAVERAEVVPHGRVVEVAASHGPLEHADGEGIALDVADRASRSDRSESEVDPSDAGAQTEGT